MKTQQENKVMPYTYKLTHKSTGQFYFGYRKANKHPADQDIGVNYFTSSEFVLDLGFHNFSIEILLQDEDWRKCYGLEQKLIKENFENPLKLNQYYHKMLYKHREFVKLTKKAQLKLNAEHKISNRLKHAVKFDFIKIMIKHELITVKEAIRKYNKLYNAFGYGNVFHIAKYCKENKNENRYKEVLNEFEKKLINHNRRKLKRTQLQENLKAV